MKKALFIGRFQPFHIGHLSVVQQMQNDKNDHIVIGIGSSQYSGTKDNPYSFNERKQMIEAGLNESNVNYEIAAIPDIYDDSKWAAHVQNIVGDFDYVYTGNKHVAHLLEKIAKLRNVEKKHEISATKLRSYIQKENNEWKQWVPKSIIPIIESYE